MERALDELAQREVINTGVILAPDVRFYPVSLDRFITEILDQEFRPDLNAEWRELARMRHACFPQPGQRSVGAALDSWPCARTSSPVSARRRS